MAPLIHTLTLLRRTLAKPLKGLTSAGALVCTAGIQAIS